LDQKPTQIKVSKHVSLYSAASVDKLKHLCAYILLLLLQIISHSTIHVFLKVICISHILNTRTLLQHYETIFVLSAEENKLLISDI
jgi:hypothetical protein